MADSVNAAVPEIDTRPWFRQLTGKHWFILIICTLGWALDTLNQQLFALVRSPAVADLLTNPDLDAKFMMTLATALMLVGWATGGIIFGVCGDKYGRVRVMFWMILLYSAATGATCLVQDINQFLALRFVSGLGFGGAFAVCATVVAESIPATARPYALAFLQAMSSFGNIMAAVIALSLGEFIQVLPGDWPVWRWAFLVGVFPILLIFFIMKMDEPEAWKKAHEEEKQGGRKVGSLKDLFGDPLTRYRVILGMVFATIGIIGFWGIMLFAIDLNRSVFRKNCAAENQENFAAAEQAFLNKWITDQEFAASEDVQAVTKDFFMPAKCGDLALSGSKIFEQVTGIADGISYETVQAKLEEAVSSEEAAKIVTWIQDGDTSLENGAVIQSLTDQKGACDKAANRWGSYTSALINFGAFLGMYAFAMITRHIGRRPTFVFFFLAAMFSSLAVFVFARTPVQVMILNPLMGFSVASLLSGYTIYFPELFPTRLRSTSVSFCYNAGRYLSAIGPFFIGVLATQVFSEAKGYEEPLRWAGASLCPIFLLGVILIWFLPETKGKPLPE